METLPVKRPTRKGRGITGREGGWANAWITSGCAMRRSGGKPSWTAMKERGGKGKMDWRGSSFCGDKDSKKRREGGQAYERLSRQEVFRQKVQDKWNSGFGWVTGSGNRDGSIGNTQKTMSEKGWGNSCRRFCAGKQTTGVARQ